MKTIRTTSEVRKNLNGKIFLLSNGTTAVIATIPFSTKKQDLGIQFWNESDLKKEFIVNTDGTISKLVEIY